MTGLESELAVGLCTSTGTQVWGTREPVALSLPAGLATPGHSPSAQPDCGRRQESAGESRSTWNRNTGLQEVPSA